MDPAHSLRSALPLVLIAFIAGALAWAFYGDRGVLANRALQRELLSRQAAVDERTVTVSLLRTEIQEIKHDRLAQERWVREELGYVKPGEILYLFPGDRAIDFKVLQDTRLREAELPGAAQ